MTGKLDQSLDTILSARKAAATRGRGRARGRPSGARATAAPTAPAGGIKKNTKKAAPKPAEKKPAAPVAKGNSKIMVSNLPKDVTESQIKEYFQKTIGNAKQVSLAFGPNGISRGIATITFGNTTAAAKAVETLDKVKVDGRPMKVEVILDGSMAPAPEAPKALADRMSQPKSAAAKPKAKEVKPAGPKKEARQRNARKPRTGRVKKTAEELDAEMTDYFQTGGETANAAPTNGDTNMDADI